MAYSLNVRGNLLVLDRPMVMGILNLTPDSFYAQSRVPDTDTALRKVEQMLKDGMDMLDIGAVSSRPGAELPDEAEERRRLEGTLKAVTARFPDLIVSVDTFRSGIARMAAECGAHIINDISGGMYDPDMFATVGMLQLPYVLMHLKEKPKNMQDDPRYNDVVTDLILYFSQKLQAAHEAGIHDVILDPGFGFAKTLEHNYRLLAHLRDFQMLRAPLLAGMSRKSMLYRLLDCSPQEALNATTAANMIALQNGADILRVHDVKEAAQCVRIFCQCRRNGKGNPDRKNP
ncbi:MAG: dihydropteroate synthase [Bacteroides sp.]|nr:dihydropteroate synthase [Ruminococcus flavefaciens]MCM1554468.1 dihydropteroate synthase [Bacteroides sp.]